MDPNYEIEKDFSKEGIDAHWEPGYPATWGSETARLSINGPIESASLNPDSKHLAVASADSIILVNLSREEIVLRIKLPGTPLVGRLEWQPHEDRLVLGLVPKAEDPSRHERLLNELDYSNTWTTTPEFAQAQSVKVANFEDYLQGPPDQSHPSGTAILIVLGEDELPGFESKCFNSDGTKLIVLGTESNHEFAVDIWNTEKEIKNWTRRRMSETHTKFIPWAEFSVQGSMLASTSFDQTIKPHEVATGELLRTFGPSSGQNWTGAFSPDARSIAQRSASNLSVLDTATGEMVLKDDGFPIWGRSVVWSPDSRYLAYGGMTGALRIRDMKEGTIIQDWQIKYVSLGVSGYKETRHIQWLDGGRKIAFCIINKNAGFDVYDLERNSKKRVAFPWQDRRGGTLRYTGSLYDLLIWWEEGRSLISLDFDQSIRFWHIPE